VASTHAQPRRLAAVMDAPVPPAHRGDQRPLRSPRLTPQPLGEGRGDVLGRPPLVVVRIHDDVSSGEVSALARFEVGQRIDQLRSMRRAGVMARRARANVLAVRAVRWCWVPRPLRWCVLPEDGSTTELHKAFFDHPIPARSCYRWLTRAPACEPGPGCALRRPRPSANRLLAGLVELNVAAGQGDL